MFESFEETERPRGFKGFLARHAGPVRDAGLAAEGIHRIGIFFLSLAAVSGVVGLAVYGNTGSPAVGLVLGSAALALSWSRSRISALILLALVLANALLRPWALFSWLWVVFAARATQLAFGYQRLRRARRTSCPVWTPQSDVERPARGSPGILRDSPRTLRDSPDVFCAIPVWQGWTFPVCEP